MYPIKNVLTSLFLFQRFFHDTNKMLLLHFSCEQQRHTQIAASGSRHLEQESLAMKFF